MSIQYDTGMLVDVYRVRYRGVKQERERIRQDKHRGELAYRVRLYDPRPRWCVMKAVLLGSDGEHYVLPVLDQARVVEVRGEGLLITGIEVIPTSRGIKNIKSDHYPQTWWCVKVSSLDANDRP